MHSITRRYPAPSVHWLRRVPLIAFRTWPVFETPYTSGLSTIGFHSSTPRGTLNCTGMPGTVLASIGKIEVSERSNDMARSWTIPSVLLATGIAKLAHIPAPDHPVELAGRCT